MVCVRNFGPMKSNICGQNRFYEMKLQSQTLSVCQLLNKMYKIRIISERKIFFAIKKSKEVKTKKVCVVMKFRQFNTVSLLNQKAVSFFNPEACCKKKTSDRTLKYSSSQNTVKDQIVAIFISFLWKKAHFFNF